MMVGKPGADGKIPAHKKEAIMAQTTHEGQVTRTQAKAPQEAQDEIRAIMRRLIAWNDKYNDRRYFSIALVTDGEHECESGKFTLEDDTIMAHNDYWDGAPTNHQYHFMQDELRADIEADNSDRG